MRFVIIILSLFVLGCTAKKEELSAKQIIEKSIQYHDINHEWSSVNFSAHIQEPRIGNPERFSVINLNNLENSFQLKRNRENHISTHNIDKNGNASTFLDNVIVTDSVLIKKYRLEPKRNKNYHRFYKVLLGLPMSLTSETKEVKTVTETIFNNQKTYKLEIELLEPLFSKNWNVYFLEKNYKMIGLEMIFPDDKTKGERLVFDGEFSIKSIKIPRMRHWYELNGEYSGSDIIISETVN